ncbi:hypothetical protein EUGRSUZ_H02668 [Eucalyptus grandis]|uniref:Uncharacterized protein n=2 Tax=Eucalyptus grandis TaxID=71139 RepID=A0ACC3JT90_EUCGR|nr:hypothetical protein EUGRSUZ_H02668 [Eucalyptus grandis]
MDYQMADFEHVMKRSRPLKISDESVSILAILMRSADWVNNLPVNILPITYNCQSLNQSSYSSYDLPRNVVITLSQGSLVKSMDFHPVQQILLLVGTNMGDVMVWEVSSGARIALRKFKIWDMGTCSMALQASLANDYISSVNRVMWSPDGFLFGVAYSKHMVHIYSYHGGDDIRNHLEIEAHVGSVNDLAFPNLNKRLCVVTCGEDKLIKVWDAVTGVKQHTFEGHEASVYSICPYHKENIQFIFSTATDGKIKAWLYDNMRSRVDYDALGHSSTVMAFSADKTRLFSCGTNKDGESYLVEWNESDATLTRTYHGLGKRSGGVAQFDTAKNRFLAAGDEFMVKFWDMDNSNLLMSTDADGGLPASPCLRFNKEGILLAISTSDNSIKILANVDGIRLLRTADNQPFDASRITLGPLMKNSDSMADVKPRIADDSGDKSRNWKLTEINEPLQCRSIRLPDNSTATRVPRLIYINSGRAILALSSNAVHKLWKWQESDQNLTGRATTSVVPQLWQPPGGNLMTNDTCGANPEDAVPCFAVSKNNFLISASGGDISCFYMLTYQKGDDIETMKFTVQLPSNNDIVEIGMEDPFIQISSGQVDETKLKGHRRIIKGFAFPTFLNVLMSSGTDSQMLITFTPRPPPATFLAFYPRDDYIIAIGMEDSSIQIYNILTRVWKANLKGHQKRITGLAFSNVLNVLLSSSADSQLCVWNTGGWEKQASKFLQMPNGRGAAPLADTRVQFHVDQIHLLVIHETQIATYKAPELECLKQWDTREASAPITDATYSCNGQSIYVSFEDGSIRVLYASTLRLRCRINPTAYIPPNPYLRLYPLVIAAHPSEPNQFALGLTDGSVYVLEPLESEGEWGSFPIECGAGPSTTTGATGLYQPQR